MRYIMIVLGVCAFVASAAGQANAQVDDRYNTLAVDIVVKAEQTLAAGDPAEAQFLFERALTANPANVRALIGLGKAHEQQGRVGRSLKYYRHALDVQSNSVRALEAQALAFLKRDIVDRTKTNLDRLKTLCETCEATMTVSKALDDYLAAKAAVALNDDNG